MDVRDNGFRWLPKAIHRLLSYAQKLVSFFFFLFFPWGITTEAGPAQSPHSRRSASFFFLFWGGSLHKQEGQVGVQESPHNTEGLPPFSRGAVRASW
jgi:hypothetical protein